MLLSAKINYYLLTLILDNGSNKCMWNVYSVCRHWSVRSWENSPSGTFRLGSSDSLHFTSVAKKWLHGLDTDRISQRSYMTVTWKFYFNVQFPCLFHGNVFWNTFLLTIFVWERERQLYVVIKLRSGIMRGIQPVYQIVNLYEHIIDTI